MHSLTVSYMCSDWELNLQAWCVGTTLQPTKLASQTGQKPHFKGDIGSLIGYTKEVTRILAAFKEKIMKWGCLA